MPRPDLVSRRAVPSAALALRRLLATAASVAAVTACGSDLVLPPENPEAPGGSAPPTLELRVMEGDGQRGTVGEPLRSPLVVRLTNDGGTPQSGVMVRFVTTGGSGDLVPDTAVTDGDGRAAARWVLGTGTGTQAVEARALDTTSTGTLAALFTAIADAAPGQFLAKVRGDGQRGGIGEPLADSLVVRVTDKYGNPVPGFPVSWRVTQGGGSVSDAVVPTGTDGRAGVLWTLGLSLSKQKVEAVAAELAGSPVTFQASLGS